MAPFVLAVLVVLFSSRTPESRTADGKVLMDVRALSRPRLPLAVEALNFFGEPWKEWLVPLDKEALLTTATRRAGLDQFWDEEAAYWNAGLDSLVADMHDGDAARRTLLGRVMIREQIVGGLVAQLKVVDAVVREPRILERDIGPVAILAGLPRTGSTALHKMLCEHPDATCLRLFEALQPVSDGVPGLPLPATAEDPRFVAAHVATAVQSWLRPWFSLMFPMQPLVPFEEVFITAQVMSSMQFLMGGAGPAYRSWYMATDHTPAYRYVEMVYKVMDHQRGDVGGGVRVMKSPQHIMNVDAIRAVFPAATLVMTERDMVPVMSSMLTILGYGVGGSFSRYDTYGAGEHLMDSMEFALQRYSATKHHYDVHVDFEAFAKNNSAIASDVIAAIGLDPAKVDLDDFVRRNPRQGAVKLEYQLQAFGVTQRHVQKRLQPLLL